MDVFITGCTHTQQGTILLSGIDKHNQDVIAEVVNPSFTITVSREECDTSILQHGDSVEQETALVIRNGKPEKSNIVHLSMRNIASFRRLRAICLRKGITLYSSSHSTIDENMTRFLLKSIGLHQLCSWHTIQTDKAISDNTAHHRKRLLKIYTENIFLSPENKLPVNMRVVLLTIEFSVKTPSQSPGREQDDLEERFAREQHTWKDCPISISGNFYRRVSRGSMVARAVVQMENDLFIFSVTEGQSDVMKEKSTTSFPSEDQLLLSLANCIISQNIDIIVVNDIETQMTHLKNRYEKKGLSHIFHSMLSKDNRGRVKVYDRETARCNHLISANLQLFKAYSKDGEQANMDALKAMKQSLKSKLLSASYVQGFGVAVLDAKLWMKNKDTCSEMVELFLEQVRVSGGNFVHCNAHNGCMKPSELYVTAISDQLQRRNICVPVTKRQRPCVVEHMQGGLVLEPTPCYTFTPVITLDFSSMYATIIESLNICFTTLCSSEDIDSYVTFERGIHCKRPSSLKGILPEIFRRWKCIREEARDDHIKEKVIKQCIVSMIGQNLSSNENIPFASPEVGRVVTATGRALLTKAKSLVTEISHPLLAKPPQVTYGDTDSLMICLTLKSPSSIVSDILERSNVVARAIQKTTNDAIAKFLQDHIGEDVGLYPSMKLEGISLGSIHFPQKKRYVHARHKEGAVDLVCKGIISVQSNATGLISQLETWAIQLALYGWYLVKRKEFGVEVLSPEKLLSLSDIVSVFIPAVGWVKDFTAVQHNDASIQEVVVCHNHQYWYRHFTHSFCIDQFLSESQQQLERCSMVEHLIAAKVEMLARGEFSIEDLVQRCQFKGHEADGEGYDKIASTVARFRQRFGLRTPLPYEDVPYVRIVRHQTVGQKWQNIIVSESVQDPIIVLREHLSIDTQWYVNMVCNYFCQDNKSLLAVMYGDILSHQLEQLRGHLLGHQVEKEHKGYRQGDAPPVPDHVKHIVVPLSKSNMTLPVGMCLVGSVLSVDCKAKHHFYCPPNMCYMSTTLAFCQELSKLERIE